MHDSSASIPGDAQGCGARLREARVAAGLERQDVAARLRMPLHVVEAIEDGRWEVIGAGVFVRGKLRSYAGLVGVDIEPFLENGVAATSPTRLVSHEHTPRYQRWMESAGRRAVYVVITAAIVVPVWLATRSHFQDVAPTTASLDAVPPGTDAQAMPAGGLPPAVAGNGAGHGAATPAGSEANAPYVASLAPSLARTATSDTALVLEFSGESWLQVTGRDGNTLEQGLVQAGDRRNFEAGQVGRVVLGNAAVARVQHAGGIVDLTPYLRANVARFAVSSDGSVSAAD